MSAHTEDLTDDALDALLNRCALPTDRPWDAERDARLQFSYDAESDIPRLVAEVKRSRAERVVLTRELDEAHASEASALERAEKAEAELARMKAERDALGVGIELVHNATPQRLIPCGKCGTLMPEHDLIQGVYWPNENTVTEGLLCGGCIETESDDQ